MISARFEAKGAGDDESDAESDAVRPGAFHKNVPAGAPWR